MKNKILMLFIALACLAGTNARAAWSIVVNGQTGSGKVCNNTFASSGTVSIQVFNGSTNVTSTCWIYESTHWDAIVPFGGSGPYDLHSNCNVSTFGSSVVSNAYLLYLLKSPTYSVSLNSGAFFGYTTLYAFDNSGTSGGPGCLQAVFTLLSVPNGAVLPGVISGPATIGASATYSVNSAAIVPFTATSPSWGMHNGAQTCYYSPLSYSGSNYTVVPQPRAALYYGGATTLNFGVALGSTSYTCGLSFGSMLSHNRTPVVTSSLAPANILCSGSAYLLANVNDYPGYPAVPGGGVNSAEVHFTFQWYKNGVAISGATNHDYNAPTVGDYYVAVTQYEQQLIGSVWSWKTTPTYASVNSNTIHIVGPTAGTLTPTVKINGTTLTTSMTSSTPVFFACGTNTLTFNGSGSGTGVYKYTLEIISGTSGTTISTLASNVVGAVPTSLDITSTFAGATSGFYGVRLTVSNGCTSSTYTGYMRLIITPPPTGNMTAGTSDASTGATHYYSVTDGATYSSIGSVKMGRTSGFFVAGGLSYGATSTTYNYQVYLYKIVSGTPSLIWNGPVNSAGSATSPYIPVVTMSSLGFAPTGSGYSWTGRIWANATLTPNNSQWYIDIALTNNCGTTHDIKYFTLDDVYSFRNDNAITNGSNGFDAITFVPVPFSKEVGVNLSLDKAATTSLTITAVDGRVISNAWENESMEAGRISRSINTQSWAPGLYFYKLTIDGATYTGKIQKN